MGGRAAARRRRGHPADVFYRRSTADVMPVTILSVVDHYLPGVKAGGPVRSVAHTVDRLGPGYRFKLVTRDRDFGDPVPYPGIPRGEWHPVGNAQALYLPPEDTGLAGLRRVLRATQYDVLYLNSLFSDRMTFMPLLLRRMGAIPRRPVVVAPRGELHPGALATGTWGRWFPPRTVPGGVTPRYLKKRLYIRACKAAGLFDDVVWQASSAEEAADVRRWMGDDARVVVAPDLGADRPPPPERPHPKEAGVLRLAYVSRVASKKNLEGALAFLADVRGRVEFDIYGPVEEAGYWNDCRRAIARLPENVTVRYHGPVEHARVYEVFREHDLMILPTWGENFGHVILEALVEGCPVLVSDQTPWRGLERRGVGWDLPLSASDAFTAVLERCVEMGPEEHRLWSQRAAAFGREWAEDEKAVQRTRELFHEALSSFPGRAPAAEPHPAGREGARPPRPHPEGAGGLSPAEWP
jgi:glycosyltransferase involved in cell wall biosynthesis